MSVALAACLPASRPPAAEPSPPPAITHRRSYVLPMIVADGLLIAAESIAVASGKTEGLNLAVSLSLLHLATGPSVHALEHNRSQVGRSLLRRIAFPLIGAGLFAGAILLLDVDCFACSEVYGRAMLIGGAAGMLTAIGWDVARAHVTVTVRF
jgi:hypothetical protein